MSDDKPSPDDSADAFRGFEHAFQDAQGQKQRDLKHAAAESRQAQVKQMIDIKISDADWNELVAHARKAAERGEKQYQLLRFPSELCTDDARAINNPPNDTWPETLRGEAAEIYQRWKATLQPHGFNITAQVLDFPEGKPGDVGLFLRWGG